MNTSGIAHIYDARPVGDRYEAQCPAHDDHNPSLSIAEGSNGKTLLRCWAGCSTEDVLAAKGLSWADLFPDSDRRIARQLVRTAHGTPAMETDPARRAELLLRDFADREGRRISNEILLRNKQITHGEKLLSRDRHNETGWKLLEDAYKGLAELEYLADLLDSKNWKDWLEAKRHIEGRAA